MEWLRRLWRWLGTNSDEIGAVGAVVGVLVGIIGFGATWYQLSSTSTALRAANGYSIQKDAREMIDKLYADSDFIASLAAGQVKGPPEAFEKNLWIMFNFYLSVYRQDVADGLSDNLAGAYARDFCKFLGNSLVATRWSEMEKEKKIGADHDAMRQKWCTSKP